MQPLSSTFIPRKQRVGRKRRATASGPTPPMALTLVSATYDPAASPDPTITLVFNQAINIDDLAGDQISVFDRSFNQQAYVANGDATLTNATTVRIAMSAQGGLTGSGVTMSAGDESGIVAASDGSEWAGVTNLVLPYS